ncbi:hypothetical protein [Effusibacillus dendaii]|uniref:Uncharacterized protein n=1 Tax=Effusibacillus dendaii TaxID=2743772 RepID=A0A7I8DE47_9BACL|nr:hypothetical protein [Effusibacillus dendaii]BCJ86161.1 hypothetical protein skT53_11460 [Effusibacillus dendaii]
MARVCEVCGAVEDVTEMELEAGSRYDILHVCENCMKDRNLDHFAGES